ncbi:type II secretion system F family protein [Haloimpatiens sp. FM7330]|uniref:type II secretion system F family protein n=1 Tax=Haloimpatiens sp. FM7330 TaxID=3298610 RepID=UPI003635D577
MYIAAFICFLVVFMFALGVLYSLNYNKLTIENRIERIKNFNNLDYNNVQDKSFLESTVIPIYYSFSKIFFKITPSYKLTILSKRLEKAGLLKNTTAEKWLYNKNMIVIVISVLLGLLFYAAESNILKVFIIVIFIIIFLNVFFKFYISRKIEIRKKIILKELPYTLDLITVSVEAGLSFDGAMARVVSIISGELCDEFSKSLKEIRMGIQRKIALKNMSERCDVKEVSTLVTALIQADELGVSLGKVLRIEASNLRERRKQAAREKAMKAPIKMLFPLIFFIFPSIFIIILGPAVIKIFKMFIKG